MKIKDLPHMTKIVGTKNEIIEFGKQLIKSGCRERQKARDIDICIIVNLIPEYSFSYYEDDGYLYSEEINVRDIEL